MPQRDDPFLSAYNKVYGADATQARDPFDEAYGKVYGAGIPTSTPAPLTPPRSTISNVVRGLAQGLGTAGTSTIGAIGTLTGSRRLQEFARRSEEEMRDFYSPEGTAGAIGTGVGRVAGEVAAGIVGGGLGVKAVTRLSPRIAQALSGASRLRRGTATALANAPIDIVQGAKSEEGIILPGRLGSIVESVGLTGAAGALLPAARAARVPEMPSAPRALPPGQYEMGPVTTRLEPETDPRRMLPSTTARPTDVGPLQGPAIPLTASAEQLTRAQLEATPEDIASYVAARNRGVIQSRSGRTFRRPASIDRAIAEAERAAIQADVAGRAAVRFPTSLKKLSDDDLRATAQAWQERLERTIGEANILDETEAIRFQEEFGTTPMGYRGAKRMTGVGEEARRYARFSEEQMGRMEELGLSPDDLKTWREANKRLPTLQSQFQRLTDELDRRGLSLVDESTDFPFGMNRPGVIAPELLAQGGGAIAGAGTGLATSPEEEDPFGRAGRAIVGGVAGMALGRAALRGLPAATNRLGRRAAGAVSPAEARMAGRETPLGAPVTDADRYANIGRMTAEEPELAEGLRETVRGAVESRELGERLAPRGKETLGRLVNTETFEDTRKRTAELLGVAPSDIVARTAKGERVGRERLLRATEELLERQQTVNALNERLQSVLVVDAEDVRQLTALRDAEREAAYDLFASISTQKTETARDLAAMRIGASLSDNPIVWKARLEELAKRSLTAEEIAEAERLALARDMNGLVRLGTQIRQATPTEKAITLYKTSLLTSPKTFLANLFGNVGMAAVRQVRDIPATFADMALASVTGQRTKVLDVKGRWEALSRGAARGLDDAKRAMRGELPSADKFREIREVNYDSALANLYTKGVFRSLDATDRMFRSLAFAESIDEQARVLARNKGLTGQAAQDFVERVTKAPTMEMTADAMLAADVATFQQSSEIARVALSARRKLGVVGDLLFPFAKTPANIAQTIVNYSPLGITGNQFRRNLKRVMAKEATTAQQRMVAERIGEVSAGTALIMLGYLKGKNGTMTGFFPADQRTRDRWEAEGKLEGSIKAGNDWVQVSRISPVGNMLTIGAALADVERGDPGLLAMALGSLAAPLSAVTELPMVQGLSNITEIIDTQATPEQREAAATRLAGGIVSGVVPFSGLIRSAQQAMDPNVREARTEGRVESALRQVGAGIPGVAQRLPVKVDPLGRPVQRGGTAIERFISPFQRRTDITTQDPVQAALAEANAVVGRVTRRKGETPEAYAERAQMTGEMARLSVGRAIASPGYAGIDTMNVDRLRRGLRDAGVDTEGLSDDGIRNAWRSVVLDRVIGRAKSAAARRIPNKPSTIRQLERAVERQP